MTHKTTIRLAACGMFSLIVIAAASIHQYLVVSRQIPLPFAQSGSSALTGDLTKIGRRVTDVYKVTFPTGVNSEKLTENNIYLVNVPDEAGIQTRPFSDVLTRDSDGSHNVNFFLYKYVTPDAAFEKQHKNDPLFADRFPGQFGASPEARAADAQHGNVLANFERDNNIVMDPTNTPTGALFRRGSLYFLIVNEPGNVTITVRTPSAAICGNGAKEGTEACDDGDTTSGDGCSATCTVESGFQCNDENPTSCSCMVVMDCVAPAPGCHYEGSSCGSCGTQICGQTCGNSVKEGTEACDSGAQNGVPCTASAGGTCTYCTLDCKNETVHGAAPVCGNGDREGTEQCDDLNDFGGDGCSATCTIESGFTCTGSPSVCLADESCGDGVVNAGEQCDDGDTENDDGCDDVCTVEQNFTCTGAPSVCTPDSVCGDGTRAQDEACDDGDTASGDGCSATCAVEANFSCNRASPNVCVTYNEFVKNLADTSPKNGTVSQNEALLVTLRIGDAISNQQYDAGLDINGDGVFNGADSQAIFTELDLLAPPQE